MKARHQTISRTHTAHLAFQACGCLLFLALLTTVIVTACKPNGGPPVQRPVQDFHALASHYAPVIHQGTASDQDYITAVNFDGDWIGNNNWENQPIGDLSANVYYSVIETATHWFIFYSLFHPRDYTPDPCEISDGCHENDLESIQLVVFKDGSPFGQLQVMETLAHGDIYLYTADSSVIAGYLEVQGPVQFEGTHPVVYVETYGHGIYGHPVEMVPGHIVYRVGQEAQVPQGMNDDVTYRLIPIYTTLWAHRNEIGDGRAFDGPFLYHGQVLPATFDGDNYGVDQANTPWGYNQATDGALRRGDWFLDPARALNFHASFKGPFSGHYLYNRYLVDLGLLPG